MKEQYTSELFGLALAKLREKKGISARKMSLDLGQNKNYINTIESGKSFPTMSNFFLICTYLKISPEEFFATLSDKNTVKSKLHKAINDMSPHKRYHLYLMLCDSENSTSDNLLHESFDYLG